MAPVFKVDLINVQKQDIDYGSGKGHTLQEAQSDALQKAWKLDPNATLSQYGTAVFFNDGKN